MGAHSKPYKPSQVRKAIVAVVGALLMAAVQFGPFIPDSAQPTVTTVVAFLTAVSVFLVRNAGLIDAGDRFVE